MNYFERYFGVCTKKALKNYRIVFLITLISVLGLALTAYALINNAGDNVSRKRVKVGIVGDLSETYLGMGFYALENMDSSKLSIEFLELGEENAKEMLAKRSISAYVVIPDKFISDLAMGRDAKLEFVTEKSSEEISALLMNEVVNAVSELVISSERGIYAVIDYSNYEEKIPNLSSNVDDINMRYIKLILDRNSIAETEILGVRDSLSIEQYYVCGVITLFLLMFGISCITLFSDKQLALGRLLASRGMKSLHLILCEYSAFLIIFVLTAFILSFAVGILSAFNIEALEITDFARCVLMTFRLIPYIAMLAAMQFFIYEIASGAVSSMLWQFVFAAGFGYVSGCFYPSYFFPQTVQNIAEYLPSGIVFKAVRLTITGENYFSLVCIGYIVLFIGLSAVIRKQRLRRT